jgi:hypothetical protein
MRERHSCIEKHPWGYAGFAQTNAGGEETPKIDGVHKVFTALK